MSKSPTLKKASGLGRNSAGRVNKRGAVVGFRQRRYDAFNDVHDACARFLAERGEQTPPDCHFLFAK